MPTEPSRNFLLTKTPSLWVTILANKFFAESESLNFANPMSGVVRK